MSTAEGTSDGYLEQTKLIMFLFGSVKAAAAADELTTVPEN